MMKRFWGDFDYPATERFIADFLQARGRQPGEQDGIFADFLHDLTDVIELNLRWIELKLLGQEPEASAK